MNGNYLPLSLITVLLTREAMRSGATRDQAVEIAGQVQRRHRMAAGAPQLGFHELLDAFIDAGRLSNSSEEEETGG